ncbi:MAG: class I SAM-dependent methyltransferase [Bacteroidia bacterium]|nr:class I SAM-dependent methyltransferase [Bacteroidia bacterium]
MSKSPRFNYIITIHNKEDLIEQVIMSVLMCCRDNSYIYPVIDGCTDKTEIIIDRIISTFSGVPITKILLADVHELLSINAGLKAANQNEEGFNIILQDDVILADFMMEKKVIALYQWAGSRLGYVSFRLGANLIKDVLTSDQAVPYCDYVENAYGHGISQAEVLLPGFFAFRTVPIKSPVCIPTHLVRTVGMFEEKLAPYGHDDLDYAIRLLKAGYRNAVFGLRFYSDIKWGGTRTTPHPQLGDIIQRNMNLIRKWHGSDLEEEGRNIQVQKAVMVPGMGDEMENMRALKAFEDTRRELARYQNVDKYKVVKRIRSIVRTIIVSLDRKMLIKRKLVQYFSKLKRYAFEWQEKHYYKRHKVYDRDILISSAIQTYPDPNVLYDYMHHYFNYRCLELVREHRTYFKEDHRGFGEDAFHAMWWLLLSEFRPQRMLEIGVYRGQVISLWSLILEKIFKQQYEVHGISPFTPNGDSVSNYLDGLDYMGDVISTFRHWNLKEPVLVKALSAEPAAINHIKSHEWDLIYIDGSHEHEIVLKDYKLCMGNLKIGGLLVIDDASLGTSFKPPSFAFAGHPGPSRVAREYAQIEMKFLCAVGHNNVFQKR